MMRIKIKETGELKELTLIDPDSGCCWVLDALIPRADDRFTFTPDGDGYEWETDQLTFHQTAQWLEENPDGGGGNP